VTVREDGERLAAPAYRQGVAASWYASTVRAVPGSIHYEADLARARNPRAN
jgi:hypothetical protein